MYGNCRRARAGGGSDLNSPDMEARNAMSDMREAKVVRCDKLKKFACVVWGAGTYWALLVAVMVGAAWLINIGVFGVWLPVWLAMIGAQVVSEVFKSVVGE